MASRHQHNVLVIGSGAAGLSLALRLPGNCRVALLTKADLNQGSTFWAQGGMAAVLHNRDTATGGSYTLLTAPDERYPKY
jgi:L-aspartate oxidase